jgi:hypothetical protein
MENPLVKFYFGHIQQIRKLIKELDAPGGDRAQKQKYLKDIVVCCLRLPLVTRTFAKYQVEKLGLDWVDVSKKLTENGWAEQINSTEVRLKANLEVTRDAMSKVFGDDCSKILSILQQSLALKSEAEVYNYFHECFIKTGLGDASFDDLLKIAVSGDYSGLLERESQVYALADKTRSLYDFEENVSQLTSSDRVGIGPHGPGILFLAIAQIQYIVNGLLEAAGERWVNRIFIILFSVVLAVVILATSWVPRVVLRGTLSGHHGDSRRIKQEQFERRRGGLYGIVAKYEVEKLGLDWVDVSKKLTENGWAEQINSTEVRLKANLDVTRDVMSKMFGNDFLKILPILQQSLYSHRGSGPLRSKQEQDVRRLSEVTQDSQTRLMQYRRDQMRDMQRLSLSDRRREAQERFMQDYQMRLRDLQRK